MTKLRLLLVLPLLSLNTGLFLMGGCFSSGEGYCAFYNKGTLTAYDNGDTAVRTIGINGISAKAMILQLELEDTIFLCYRPFAYAGNAAYAFRRSLRADTYTQIDSVQITSNRDFDATHPAGANLIGLFTSIELNAGNRALPGNSARYFLMHSPADTGTHTFTLHTFTSNPAHNISISSAPVKLLL